MRHCLFLLLTYLSLFPAQSLATARYGLVLSGGGAKGAYEVGVWRYGASLGKIVMGIMVLDSEILDFPSLPKALIRACVRIISEWCFYLGFIWMLGNAAKQSWHDKLSGTIVCENK